MREINLNRQLLGLEDLEFGTGTVEQIRAGTTVTITKINAGNLPFDETRTLLEFTRDTNIEELGNSVEAINNLNNNLDKLLIVEDNLPIINNVEAIKESIVTLDINILALQNIDTNMSSINTVEDNLTEVVSVAQNIVPNLTEILNVDTLASQVTQDKSDVSSMKLAVETIYDTFDDRFLGTKTVDPTLDNDGNALIDGAMYFNTSSNTMKVYDIDTTTWYSIPQIYLSALLDVNLTSITSGNVLRWTGTKWINYTLSKSDVGLNLVDNTADSVKNVLSATKLTTARSINGVAFDGSEDITTSDSTKVAKVTSTDNAIVKFNGVNGEVQNSGVIVDDNNFITTQIFNQDGTEFDGIEYFDDGLLGVPDTTFSSTGARLYPDGTIRGKSSYGEYVKYPNGKYLANGSGVCPACTQLRVNRFGSTSGNSYFDNLVLPIPMSVITADAKMTNSDYASGDQTEIVSYTSTTVSIRVWAYDNLHTLALSYTIMGEWK